MPKLVVDNEVLSYELTSEDFRTIAIRAHGDQQYAGFPYSMHLAMVEHILVNHGYKSYEYRAAAWFHDLFEDTKTSAAAIGDLYGEDVVKMAYACTGIGPNRAARAKSIYDKIKLYPRAAPVKVADRIANMKYGLATKNPKALMYVKEFPLFSENLRGIMTETRQGAILWNSLEDVVSKVMAASRENRLQAA